MSAAGRSAATAGIPARLGPLGFGAAPIANLGRVVSEADARAALEAAWAGGVRYYDTAPHYGLGLSERRLGAFLRERPRDEFVISTKVGRVLEPNPDYREGAGDSGFEGTRFDGSTLDDGFAVPARLRRRFDPSEAGIRRSLEDSLDRLGLDRVDVLFLHDPDAYDLDRGLSEGLPALARLRDEGLVDAIGVGVNDAAVAARAVREGDLDVVMVAGRYTLLEQPAADELLPLCEERGVAVVAAAPFNSGLLATETPAAEASYNYAAAPVAVLERARALADACRAEGWSLPAAALQFPLRHPAVAAVVVGTARAEAVRENLERLRSTAPDGFWERLADRGLVPRMDSRFRTSTPETSNFHT